MEKQQIEKLYFAKRIVDFPSQKSCFLTCTDQRSSVNTVYENRFIKVAFSSAGKHAYWNHFKNTSIWFFLHVSLSWVDVSDTVASCAIPACYHGNHLSTSVNVGFVRLRILWRVCMYSLSVNTCVLINIYYDNEQGLMTEFTVWSQIMGNIRYIDHIQNTQIMKY